MGLTIIVGTQWGDEAKGKITDLLAQEFDVVARYNGGDNAGHTIARQGRTFKLHLVPSGVLHPRCQLRIGNGAVVNPQILLEEMDELREAGVDISPQRLKLSDRAHLIMPYHRALDGAAEQSRGDSRIGTTRRGIGPAYADKAARSGLRAGDMLAPDFAQRVREAVVAQNKVLEKVYGQSPLSPEEVADQYAAYAERLRPYIADTSLLIHQALETGQKVLAEGAQGMLLDLDHGTYPYVTSSSPIAGGAFTGLGIGPGYPTRVVGVAKAYTTRVGAGPFPTELTGPLGDQIRGTGDQPWDEYGTTTGRPRRCGWLDLTILRYAARINGLTELVITKLDVLSSLDRLQVSMAYELDGHRVEEFPSPLTDLARCRPIYEELEGWEQDIMGVRTWEDLPPAAQAYVEFIEQQVGVPVTLISIGPERRQSLRRK
ncbi:MAG: adenylosuccinate synthase [Chloroflexota bacterium]|nr:adenylosuccinate synthase [Chloroflexota bacterium]